MKTTKKTRTRSSRDGGVRRIRNFRFSDIEWKWLHAQAKKGDTTVSAIVRGLVLAKMPIENPDGFSQRNRDGVRDVETG